jgi:hypothetical protein
MSSPGSLRTEDLTHEITGKCGKLHNMELLNLYSSHNIANISKLQNICIIKTCLLLKHQPYWLTLTPESYEEFYNLGYNAV